MRTTHRTGWGINQRLILATIAALVTATSLGVGSAYADSQQKNKNLWRNATAASGAAALYGLSKHNATIAAVGGATAVYSARRYEDDRHHQSQAQQARANRARFHHYLNHQSMHGQPGNSGAHRHNAWHNHEHGKHQEHAKDRRHGEHRHHDHDGDH